MAKWILNRVTTELPPATPPAGSTERPTAEPVSVPPRPSPLTRRRVLRYAAIAVAIVLVAWGLTALVGNKTEGPDRESGGGAVTAKVERHDFVRSLRIHGTVEAVQFYPVAAPRLAGPGPSNLVITHLAAAGSTVKRGELLVEFDRQTQMKNFLDRQAEYRDLLEQIKKRQAEQDAARARDETELKQAENAVQTAALEMRKNEVLSRIDAEKNQQNLEEARARLAQLGETFELKRAAARANLRILEIQRDRALNAMRHAERNAEKMAIRAPMDGLVVLNQIWKGGRMGEVQEGEEIRPGTPFLHVVNPSAMQARARVNQADVPYLRAGQRVQVRLDAYPELVFAGKVEQMAAIGVTSGMSNSVRTFAATFSIEGSDPKLLPDLSAAVEVELERVPGALVVPRDAVWGENGQAYVSVKNGFGFEKRAVKTGAKNDHEVVVESGVEVGAVVERNHAGSGGQS